MAKALILLWRKEILDRGISKREQWYQPLGVIAVWCLVLMSHCVVAVDVRVYQRFLGFGDWLWLSVGRRALCWFGW